jgi:hypothetical protein
MRWELTVLAGVGVLMLASGCGSTPGPSPLGETNGPDAGVQVPSCATPNTGCPCSSEGQQSACGSVVMKSGDYVTCSEGTRTCAGGSWGTCVGAFITTKFVSSTSGIRVQTLNPAVACNDDPCDPTCATFKDDPSGLDAGPESGLTINEAGISLTGVPVPLTTCSALQITPNIAPAKDLVITSMAPSPNTVQYTAALVPPSCYAGLPSFLWSVDKYDVAQIGTAGLLTLAAPIAGPITVSAYAGSLSAAVVCNVTVNVVDTTAAPIGYTNLQFPVTTGLADNISVLYPYPSTVFPLGLPSPLIQWRDNNSPATTASAVKVTLRFPATGTPMFSWSEIVPELQAAPTPTLAAQPRATIPQTVWTDFQQSVVRNSGPTGGDAVFAIQRFVGGLLYAEVPTTIHFANGQLKGNVFYNSYGTNLVKNFGNTLNGASFGAATLQVPLNGTTPTVVVGYNDPSLSGAGCRVCHNVSADGSRVLSNSYLVNGNSGGGGENTTFTYNPTLGSPALIQGSESLAGSYGSNKFTYAALSPDGTYMFSSAAPASAGGSNKLYTLAGNLIASNVPSSLGAATPAFSADAQHIAFNYYNGNATPLSAAAADGKSLAMMDFAPPATFSNFRILSTPPSSAAYSVWPSFLPPGQNGVVFQNEVTLNGRDWAGTRSTCDGTGACNNTGATAELWWVSTGASPVATRLSTLNGGSYLPRLASNLHGTSTDNPTYYEEVYNYEPTVLPVTVGGYSWVAFTTRRLYGNVATINPYWSDPRFQDLRAQPTTKKIWIAAIAPNPTPGTDPSFPAFYLPGQELLAGNSRAYLSLAACEAPGPPTPANLCQSDLDCCGALAVPPTAACQLDPPPLGNPPTSHCMPRGTATCVADGAGCTSDGQCCNFASGSRCGSGVCSPTPPILTYSSAPFVVDFTAMCPSPKFPVWRFFSWESSTPAGTSIAFTAQTSTDGVTYGAPVPVGTAMPPPVVTPTWAQGPQTVDVALRASGQSSQTMLRVTATLNASTNHTVTPTLTNWQQRYDCMDME